MEDPMGYDSQRELVRNCCFDRNFQILSCQGLLSWGLPLRRFFLACDHFLPHSKQPGAELFFHDWLSTLQDNNIPKITYLGLEASLDLGIFTLMLSWKGSWIHLWLAKAHCQVEDRKWSFKVSLVIGSLMCVSLSSPDDPMLIVSCPTSCFFDFYCLMWKVASRVIVILTWNPVLHKVKQVPCVLCRGFSLGGGIFLSGSLLNAVGIESANTQLGSFCLKSQTCSLEDV